MGAGTISRLKDELWWVSAILLLAGVVISKNAQF